MDLARAAFAAALLVLWTGFTKPVYADGVQLIAGAKIASVGEREARHCLKDREHGLLALGVVDQRLPSGRLAITAEAAQCSGSDYLNVPIRLIVNGQPIRSVLAGYRIVKYIWRPLAVHDLPQGHLLDREDFILTKIIDDNSQECDIQTLLGRSLTSALAQGHMPQSWQTASVQVVYSGEPVVLIIRDGNVALAADVVARTAGGIGEAVTVYDEHSERTMSAVVTAPGQVEVRLAQVGDS